MKRVEKIYPTHLRTSQCPYQDMEFTSVDQFIEHLSLGRHLNKDGLDSYKSLGISLVKALWDEKLCYKKYQLALHKSILYKVSLIFRPFFQFDSQ